MAINLKFTSQSSSMRFVLVVVLRRLLSVFYIFLLRRREREREKKEKRKICSSENGKMLLHYDVLALARASKRRER
jgi:hypothetical protein